MASVPPFSPAGLPSSPRGNRQMQMLSPLDTSFSAANERTPSPYSGASDKQTPQSSIDIFSNATIPLSPTSSTSSAPRKEQPYDGLTPRKRSGLARLFSCFGREERARRKMMMATEFEKVGEPSHWTEC